MNLSAEEIDELRRAKELLENPSFAARLTELVGGSIEKTLNMLPERAASAVNSAVEKALARTLDVALATTGTGPRGISSDRWHKLAGVTSGAIGGFFGLAGLPVELPVTTVIMLRSIGDIARSEGEDLSASDTRIACLEVFALGGGASTVNAVETGYYAIRGGLASLVTDAVRHVAARGAAARGAPGLVRFMQNIAARFGVVVQEKVAFELFPVVGAASGALINAVFIDHFQNVARGHFVVRRLERKHGLETVRQAYLGL